MKKKKQAKALNKVKGHLKCISAVLVGYGVGEIMGNVMSEYKPDAKGIQKMLIKIGAIALTGMVIKNVTDYVDGEIDDIFDMAEEAAAHAKVIMEEEELSNDESSDREREIG